MRIICLKTLILNKRPNETRPLSHGITAHFLFLIYTEPDEAVKSWDNGRFSFGLYKQKRKRPLSYGITAAFGSVYIIKKIVFIPNNKTALKSMLCTEQDTGIIRHYHNSPKLEVND